MARELPIEMNMNVFPPRSETASTSLLPAGGQAVPASSARELQQTQSHQRPHSLGNHDPIDQDHTSNFDSPHEIPMATQHGGEVSESDYDIFGARRRQQPHQHMEEGDHIETQAQHHGGIMLLPGDTQPAAREPSEHAHAATNSTADDSTPASQQHTPAWMLTSKRWILDPVCMALSPLWPLWTVVRAMPGALAVWLLLAYAERSSRVSVCAYIHTCA